MIRISRSRRSPVLLDAPAWGGPDADLARGVLLAFADLGIYLPAPRRLLITTARTRQPAEPGELEAFIDHCITAGLLQCSADGLRLAAREATRLSTSLDGHTPVPEDQARRWAGALTGAAAPA